MFEMVVKRCKDNEHCSFVNSLDKIICFAAGITHEKAEKCLYRQKMPVRFCDLFKVVYIVRD